jgi:hypothetical protein
MLVQQPQSQKTVPICSVFATPLERARNESSENAMTETVGAWLSRLASQQAGALGLQNWGQNYKPRSTLGVSGEIHRSLSAIRRSTISW